MDVSVDVNVLLDLLTEHNQQGRNAHQALVSVLAGTETAARVSEHVLDETYYKLVGKFGIESEKAAYVVDEIEKLMLTQGPVVNPAVTINHYNTDLEDQDIVALVRSTESAMLLTTNAKDFKSLTRHGVGVVTPAAMVEEGKSRMSRLASSEPGKSYAQLLDEMAQIVSGQRDPSSPATDSEHLPG